MQGEMYIQMKKKIKVQTQVKIKTYETAKQGLYGTPYSNPGLLLVGQPICSRLSLFPDNTSSSLASDLWEMEYGNERLILFRLARLCASLM